MRAGFFGAAPEPKPVQPLHAHSRDGADSEHNAPRVQLSIHDFDVGEELGEGSFSHVLAVTRKRTDERCGRRRRRVRQGHGSRSPHPSLPCPHHPKRATNTPHPKPYEGWDATACCLNTPACADAAATSATKGLIDASARLLLRAGVTQWRSLRRQ
jgi:hypothetical protein